MAHFRTFYVPSCAEGKTWKIYFHKPQGRPGYVAAAEGELKDGFFTYMPFSDRQVTVKLPGRATFKAIADAGQKLLKGLADDGCILADAVSEFTPCLAKH
jgi:hypothetical protein